MRKNEFSNLLIDLADDWTNRDYAAVAERFADTVFYSDPLNYTFRNASSLLEFFRDDDGKPQVCTFHDFAFDEERQIGTAEYTYEGTYRYHGTVWIELMNHKIVSWREYQHKSERDWNDFWDR